MNKFHLIDKVVYLDNLGELLMMKSKLHLQRKFLFSFLIVVLSLGFFANPSFAKAQVNHKAKHHAKAHAGKKNKKSRLLSLSGVTSSQSKITKYMNSISLSSLKSTQENESFKYITEQIKERNLPKELAWLPLVESNFNPEAVSNKGAAGLWQFMPATGKQYGLKQTSSLDERKDLKASTKAALTHLEYLHKKFDRDWNLALAAYNAGEGTIEKAIKKNKKAGKATNFWSLRLSKETCEYVPKFIGISRSAKKIDDQKKVD